MIQIAGAVALATSVGAAEFHVAIQGNDTNLGTSAAPLRTIQHAADFAQPGDVVADFESVVRRFEKY